MSEQLNQAQLTAPETIYLQHNDSGYMDEPFPADHSGTSWCDEEVFSCDVRYVRADIAEGKQAELQARIAELERLIEHMSHKAELYDEVCAMVGKLGHMNVTNAVSALQARIAELERSVEWWQSCTKDCGDVINDGIGTRQQLRAENDQLRAKVAQLEAQAAIGRRAVEMLREIAAEADDPLCHIGQRVSAILRDAEQAGMGVGL